jgi:hypothetical protein
MKRILFVDFENVPKVDLSALPDDVHVPFFFGASQKTVPKALFDVARRLGERFISIDIEGQGKNALDFHIAFYLGELLNSAPRAECVILSRDKGFDPLVRHLVGRGFAVRRVGTVAEAFAGERASRAERAERTERSPRAERAAPRAPRAPAPERQRRAPAVDAEALERVKHWLARLPARNRPRKRKGLVASLKSHLAGKLETPALEALVDALVAEGVVSAKDGALTWNET